MTTRHVISTAKKPVKDKLTGRFILTEEVVYKTNEGKGKFSSKTAHEAVK